MEFMLPEQLTKALKEWAVTQRAMLEGHQILLLRKGGLVEETGDFDLRAQSFLLYPTYEHETERLGDIQPCFSKWLVEEEENKPGAGLVRISAAAEVLDVARVENRAKLLRLSPTHIWSSQFIDGRFDWEPYKPIFVLLLRVYALPEPYLFPVLPEYGGCTSWIDLAKPIPTAGSTPAIKEEFFNRRRELTLKVLQQDT